MLLVWAAQTLARGSLAMLLAWFIDSVNARGCGVSLFKLPSWESSVMWLIATEFSYCSKSLHAWDGGLWLSLYLCLLVVSGFCPVCSFQCPNLSACLGSWGLGTETLWDGVLFGRSMAISIFHNLFAWCFHWLLCGILSHSLLLSPPCKTGLYKNS